MTADDACKHPIWKMGRKIKHRLRDNGQQGARAHRSFAPFRYAPGADPGADPPPELCPRDGQNSGRGPVRPDFQAGYAPPHPHGPLVAKNTASSFGFADLAGKNLEFYEPQRERYPLLWIARQALDEGEAQCIVYNAANEVAVQHFDRGNILFTQIAPVVLKTLERDGICLSVHSKIYSISTPWREKSLPTMRSIMHDYDITGPDRTFDSGHCS